MSSLIDRCMEDEEKELELLRSLHRKPSTTTVLKDVLVMYVQAILAGMCIALGGCMFLGADSKLSGAFLFSFGLLTILTFKLPLFTGRVGYLFHEKDTTVAKLFITLAGNMTGTNLISWIIIPSQWWASIDSKVDAMVLDNLSATWYGTLFAAIGCGMFMYIAVEGNRMYNDVRGSIITIGAVVGFIMSGCQHSIANMFYIYVCRSTEFIQSSRFDYRPLCWVGLMVLGNAIGSQIVSLLQCKPKPSVFNITFK